MVGFCCQCFYLCYYGRVKNTTNNINNNSSKESTPRTCVSYARISCESSSEENLSLTAQIKKNAAYAEFSGLEVIGEFTEIFSGKSADNREEFQKALKLAKKTKSVFVVYSLSRFARSTTDALLLSDELNKAGCELVLLQEKIDTTTSAGRLFFSITASFASYERELISERTANALSVKRQANKRISGYTPLGYDLAENGEDLIENKNEQKIITRIKNLRAEGFSFYKISQVLNAEKIKTKTGKKFAPNTVRTILIRQAKLATA